jgi:hypothetical protein
MDYPTVVEIIGIGIGVFALAFWIIRFLNELKKRRRLAQKADGASQGAVSISNANVKGRVIQNSGRDSNHVVINRGR